MWDSAKGGFFAVCCAATDLAEKGHEVISDKTASAKLSAGDYALTQIKTSLEGAVVQVTEAPDVIVTILEVNLQDGMEVDDLLDFRLSGLRCHVKLEAKGTAAQLTAMAAAGTAEKVLGKAAALPGLGFVSIAADKVAELKGAMHSSAAAGAEVKSVEFDIDCDLGVKKAGDEVSAGCKVVGDVAGAIEKIVPIGRALSYVEEAIRDTIAEAAKSWAKKAAKSAVKGVVGEDAYAVGKAGVKGAVAAHSAAKSMIMGSDKPEEKPEEKPAEKK